MFFFFEQIIIVEVSCPEMDFGLFPLDTQSCGLFIKYRGSTTYFIPCSVMVVVSWMSFSVGVEAVPGRLGLLITLLLMLMNHTIMVAKQTPHSDRICPLIVWIGISIIFVVVALFEYFVILTMLKFGRNNTNTKVAKYNILLKI